jgi:hypothetical protein
MWPPEDLGAFVLKAIILLKFEAVDGGSRQG